MSTQVVKGSGTPSVERPAGWHTWDVDFSAISAAESINITLGLIPAGTYVVDAQIIVARAETVSTTPVASMTLSGATIVASASIAATGVLPSNAAGLVLIGANGGIPAASNLTLSSSRAGSAPGVFPKLIVSVLLARIG